MSPRKAAKPTRAQKIREYHQRQLEAGWRRLGLRLNPEAANDLAALCELYSQNPTQVITELLHTRVREWIDRLNAGK